MIEVERITKSFGGLPVWESLTLKFPEQRITAILGPSGCGKTTLLNALAGLTAVDSGNVQTTSKVSYLFQEPRLLPWLTVEENIQLVLQDRMTADQMKAEVAHYLEAMGLNQYRCSYPAQLSGGWRQRVALARAYAYPASLLLMDEPFKSQDLKTRFQMMEDLLQLWRRKPRTIIAVTHDVKEAVMLGDKIIVLSEKPARVITEIERVLPRELESKSEADALERALWEILLR